MLPDWIVPALLTIITASTPLVFAAVGEIVVEKSGVLNLGVEGMMVVGAIAAFAIGVTTVAVAARSGLRGIAVEAGGALVCDADAVAREADRAQIFVVGVAVAE